MQNLKSVFKNTWEIPKSGKMNVPIRLYANPTILKTIDQTTIEQAKNVAALPGIVGNMHLFSDAHVGYGMPVGGTAAFDAKEGIISPAAVGYDINCGMRLMPTNLSSGQVKPKIKQLMDELFKKVPVGLGRQGIADLSKKDFDEVIISGAKWAVKNGYGWKEDLKRIEENGCIKGADSSKVSKKALERGREQVGTLGSGNHYLEVQFSKAQNIFDEKTAKAFGLNASEKKDQVVIMIHCGSRGFGHQVCTDFGQLFVDAMKKYGIQNVGRDLACGPFQSEEGQNYYAAMACAANNAFANRQVIMHRTRLAFEKVFGEKAEDLQMHLTYDVGHNMAKLEKHFVDGKKQWVVVHRKGSTRSFGPGEKDLCEKYRKTGQPVIVGGSMETGSYLCVGTQKAMKETFGSTLHGSGRTMSRQSAKEKFRGEQLQSDMEKRGIFVKAASLQGLAEEAGGAYKNINDVIDSMHGAGISLKVAALKPMGNIKG
ncbi:MAG: RtcB family protein [Candidatus Micrarchaeota archaeon]